MEKFYSLFVVFFLFSSSQAAEVITQYRGDYEYNKKTNAFYKLHIDTTFSRSAKDMCGLEGAKLMVPISKEDIIQVHGMMKKFPDIGNYVWVGEDGQLHEAAEEIPLIDLHSTERETDTASSCDVVTRDGQIETYHCYNRLPYVCKVAARDAVFDTQCRVYALGYQYFASAGSCYKVSNLALTWDQAYAECRAEGAHLAVINSQLEKDTIKDVLNAARSVANSRTSYFFFAGIRARRPTDGTPREFRTVSNETLEQAGFNEWSDGEPNNYQDSEYCGTIFKNNGKYNDVDCNHEYAFICENEVHS